MRASVAGHVIHRFGARAGQLPVSVSGPSASTRRHRSRLAVDLGSVIHTVAVVTRWLSLAMVAPMGVALWYGESIAPFVWTLIIGTLGGLAVERLTHGAKDIGVREAFLVVSLAWAVAAALGAVPYLFDGGHVSRPVDAYFEAMSGFTTTGATAMTNIEGHGHGILFWRSMSQWLGGMGIIVLALAILPRLSVGGSQLMQNEAPGPELDKLAPRIADAAKRLWLLYLAFTVVEVLLLCAVGYGGLAPGMDLYNAVCCAFSTMATGGFLPNGRSMETFGPWAQWIVIVFMLAAGANFALWWRGIFRDRRWFLKDEELRAYLGLLFGIGGLVALILYLTNSYSTVNSIRNGLFQVVSMMTTTGFASTDYIGWPQGTLLLLILVMFIGGCSGSTGGAIKVVRVLVVTRLIRSEVRRAAHPQAVAPVRVSGKPVSDAAVRAAAVFTLVYIFIFALGVLVLLLDAHVNGLPLDAFTAISASATTIGNVGPGVGFAGPMGSFAPFSDLSMITMTVLMWIGRLEIFPVLVLLSRWYWLR